MCRFAFAMTAVVFFLQTLSAPAQSFLGKHADGWAKELKSEDAAVRRRAAFALGKCGKGQDTCGWLDGLVTAMKKDADAGVRETAAFAIGEIGPAAGSALPALVEVMKKDEEPAVRRAAAGAIGMLWQNSADAVKNGRTAVLRTVSKAALNQLRDQAGETADALRTALQDKDVRVRQNAAWSLGQTGPAGMSEGAVRDLSKLLRDADALARRDAAMALSKAGEHAKDAVGELAGVLGDEEVTVRQYAAMALGNLGTRADAATSVVPALRKALADGDPLVREFVALALLNAVPSRAEPAAGVPRDFIESVPALAKALGDSEPRVRRNAAGALSRIGPDGRDALPELVRLLKDADPEVRRQAANALAELREHTEPEIPAIVGALEQETDIGVRAFLTRVFQYIDLAKDQHRRAREVLIRIALKDPDRITRYQAAWAIALRLGPEGREVTPTLIEFLRDRSVLKAAGATGTAKTSGAESGMGTTGVSEASGGDARAIAARGLGLIGRVAGPEARRALVEASKDESPELREIAKEALKAFQ